MQREVINKGGTLINLAKFSPSSITYISTLVFRAVSDNHAVIRIFQDQGKMYVAGLKAN